MWQERKWVIWKNQRNYEEKEKGDKEAKWGE